MSPRLRKFALMTHIMFSVGWIGAVVAFLTLVVAALTNPDPQVLRASWIAMAVSGWYAIVPLAIATVFTGLVMSLGTKWGLIRHYWTVISFLLTVVATAVLLENMQTVSFFAREAAGTVSMDTATLRGGLASELLHSGVGLIVLLVVQVLNVYKPVGMTRYGWRKQYAQRPESEESSQPR